MPNQNTINVWDTQKQNYVNGNGCRFVIWVQGCHLSCADCWNKQSWSFDKKNQMSVDELFLQIIATDGINGVTFSGGEPFIQAKNLSKLASRLKKETTLTLQIFTGYELHELHKRYDKELLSLADVVVSGRFDTSKPYNNQKVHRFSTEDWAFNNTDVEIEIDIKGAVTITGYPENKLIENLKEVTQ